MYEWNERKRQSNLEKHGFDFDDAHTIYDNPLKLTLNTFRNREARKLDLAAGKVAGMILALTYVIRGERVRVISLRIASREERMLYARSQQN